MKIVGFMLRSDLKTIYNSRYIISKAYSRMWILRRLKAIGATRTRLIDVLQKQVLSVVTLGVAAWDCMWTMAERTDFSRVLWTWLHINWGSEYKIFEDILKKSKIRNLQSVKDKIVKKKLSENQQNTISSRNGLFHRDRINLKQEEIAQCKNSDVQKKFICSNPISNFDYHSQSTPKASVEPLLGSIEYTQFIISLSIYVAEFIITSEASYWISQTNDSDCHCFCAGIMPM